jgi:hypothetical protein
MCALIVETLALTKLVPWVIYLRRVWANPGVPEP